MKKKKMLIISGNVQLFEQLFAFFAQQYQIELAQDDISSIKKMYQLKPDVVILSDHLPSVSGVELCTQIRAITKAPILMLGEALTFEERIRCYEAGADDILNEPIQPLELYYRINVLLRRGAETVQETDEPNLLVFGNVAINRTLHTVRINGEEVAFTKKEFSLLWVLLKHRNQVVRRSDLIRVIWGYDHIGDDRMLDTHLNRLRKKLLANRSDLQITTIWGLGYKLERTSRGAAL